jgi:Flp pilus assembly protein TadG
VTAVTKGWQARGQSLVEFSLVVMLLMLVIVATAQVAIDLHYRSSLQLATQEAAFEGSLAGHGPQDAQVTADALWSKLEPGGGHAQVTATTQGELVVVSAQADAPVLLPLPFAPFTKLPLRVRSVHTIERFQPGSQP